MTNTGEHLAFIVGNYKSGSTWLVNALSCHPWIRGLSETHVFRYTLTQDLQTCTSNLFAKTSWSEGGLRNLPRHRVATWFKAVADRQKPALNVEDRPNTLLDLSVVDQLVLKRMLLRSVSKEDYCQRFFQFLLARLKPQGYLLEKTPNNVPYVSYIKSIFPLAKLIIIYRDGRDVVVSEKASKSNRTKKPWSFLESTHNWRRLVEDQLRCTEKYDIFTCSYESLLQEGDGTLEKLLRYLAIPAEAVIVKNMLERSSFQFITGRNAGEEDRSSFYRKGIAGDWKNHFTETEKRIFKDTAGDMLIKLGYEDNYDW